MNTKFVFNRHTFINFQRKIRFNFNYPKYPQILMLNRQCSPRFTQRAARVQRTPDYATRNNHVRAHLPSSEAHVSGHESISYLSALPRVIFTRVKSYNSWQHFRIREEKKKEKLPRRRCRVVLRFFRASATRPQRNEPRRQEERGSRARLNEKNTSFSGKFQYPATLSDPLCPPPRWSSGVFLSARLSFISLRFLSPLRALCLTMARARVRILIFCIDRFR